MTTNDSESLNTSGSRQSDSTANGGVQVGTEMIDAMQMEENGAAKLVYVIGHPHKLYKIGISRQPAQRLRDIQNTCPYKLEIVGFAGFRDSELAEEVLHNQFADDHIRGEWFDIHEDMMDILFSDSDRTLQSIVLADDGYPYEEAPQ